MQAPLFARETGHLPPHDLARCITDQLLHAFAPAPQHRFNGEAQSSSSPDETDQFARTLRAHAAGVSALALEKFEGRLLVSGGSEGSIKIWDLDEPSTPHARHVFGPVSTIRRDTEGARVSGGGGHSHGVTHLAFYPFDQDAFLSSSYDKTLKLWATQRAALTAQFDLNATIYSHATSPLADHLLVSCATQHSNVRLVDLKSGAAVQALVSHGGPVLTTAWSPRREHVLASGHADGKVRIWDVRRSGGPIALLDQEDSVGITAAEQTSRAHPRSQATAQAHDEPVNGLAWTDDGAYIVSAGLDRKVRVWDAATGANTLASFGPLIQNQHVKTAAVVVPPSPAGASSGGRSSSGNMLVWPNDHEILMLDLHHGNLLTRLRSPRGTSPPTRITTLAWRSHGGGTSPNGRAGMGGNNSLGAIYSAHSDGQIRAWMPLIPGPDDIDDMDPPEEAAEEKSRKRKAIDSAYRSLMGREITFTGAGASR
ncbi:hypothetical protein E4U43_006727 [Claviceps pusilla]|uniref:Microtubule-interacting protein n=1 Tax=Claviceps pusilla TaxID=123648 RepID=A0A9P7NFF3_9HYPO|nr:hypothetical protein E4U43_006727 [Claviceps pusilla]